MTKNVDKARQLFGEISIRMFQLGISEVAYRVFIGLLGCAADFNPTRAKLSQWTGLQPDRVTLGMHELIESGWLDFVEKAVPGKMAAIYTFKFIRLPQKDDEVTPNV